MESLFSYYAESVTAIPPGPMIGRRLFDLTSAMREVRKYVNYRFVRCSLTFCAQL